MTSTITSTPAPPFSVFDDPTEDEIATVFKYLRAEDKAEFAAWGMDAHKVYDTMLSCRYKWVAYQHEMPVFVFGLAEHAPGSYYLCGAGSSLIDECTLKALTRYGLKSWLPELFGVLGVRRIEAIVPSFARHSVRWLRFCGMKIEGFPIDVVRKGDQFIRLHYTVSMYEDDKSRVHFSKSTAPSDAAGDADPIERGHSTRDGAAAPRHGALH